MNEKLSITIEVSKIPKANIVERAYFDKSNKQVVVKELKLDIVPLREPKLIKEQDTWAMWKTHFVAIPQTKEERERKIKSTILGDGIMFKDKKVETAEPTINLDEVDNSDGLPF